MSGTPFTPTANKSDHSRRLTMVHAVLVLIWVIVVVISLSSLSGTFAATQAAWQVNEVAASLGTQMSYETLVALVTGIRLGLLGLFLATAALLLKQPSQMTTLLAAFTLTTFPFTVELVGHTSASGAVGDAVSITNDVLGVLGLVALLILLFTFPNGHSVPRWMPVPLAVVLVVIVAAFALPDAGDVVWPILISTVVLTMLAASLSQLWRYRHSQPEQRHQTIWFLIATFAFVIWIAVSVLWISDVVSLVMGYLPLILLPIALITAVWRGAWGPVPTRRQRLGFAAVVGLLSLTSFAGTAAWWQQNQTQSVDVNTLFTEDPVPLLLDADMAMDDITALFYLLQHPNADLRAITINGVAFAHCDGGVHNTLGLLELAVAPEIPVSCGREVAFRGGTPAPEAWRRSADNLYGASVRIGDRIQDPRPATQLFADTVRDAPGEIVVLAVGPLTNLAEAFEMDPELPRMIKAIVIMGGAVDVAGNVANEAEGIDNQYAEWNIFADPVAADIVLRSGARIMLVPLDATNEVPFGRAFHQKLSSRHVTKPATFIYNLFYLNPYWLDGGMYWWDTLAVAAGLDPSLVTLEDATISVVIEAGPEIGRTRRTPDGTPVQLATHADARRFEALLLALLNR